MTQFLDWFRVMRPCKEIKGRITLNHSTFGVMWVSSGKGQLVFVGHQLCWKDHLVFICHAVCMYVQMYVGCAPLNTVPILSCVKAYSKNGYFRAFIMIKISHMFSWKIIFISIRWEAILWVVTGSIFRRLSKKLTRPFCKRFTLSSPRLLQKI